MIESLQSERAFLNGVSVVLGFATFVRSNKDHRHEFNQKSRRYLLTNTLNPPIEYTLALQKVSSSDKRQGVRNWRVQRRKQHL